IRRRGQTRGMPGEFAVREFSSVLLSRSRNEAYVQRGGRDIDVRLIWIRRVSGSGRHTREPQSAKRKPRYRLHNVRASTDPYGTERRLTAVPTVWRTAWL